MAKECRYRLTRKYQINYLRGSVYENAVAQELVAHGFPLFYFNSKKQGEVDFLIELSGDALPIEVKSGKDYTRHAALDNLLSASAYSISRAIVLQNDNVRTDGKILYLPVYMTTFLRHSEPVNLIYSPDLTDLTSS